MSPDGWSGKIRVMKTLKGNFSGDTVATAPSSGCGIDRFDVGQEYVFFLGPDSRFVSHLTQPDLAAEQTLEVLRTIRR